MIRQNIGEGAALAIRRQVFKTRDAEEARNYLSTREFVVDFPVREIANVDMRVNGAFLSNLYLGHLQYGASAEVRTNPSLELFRIVAPIRGRIEAAFPKESASCGRGQAILISPTHIRSVRSERAVVGTNIFLTAAALRRHLTALLGDPPKADLQFAPIVDLSKGYGQSLAHYASAVIADLEHAAPLLNPISAGLLEQFVVLGLLLAHPHNYSDELHRRDGQLAPRSVRRAMDYIDANLDEPIGFTDIAAAAGIPGRTLSQHFRRFQDTTPMHYLRDARLDKVHDALRRAEPEESIISIASRWGFLHMGRFAAMYRKRFGEAPSETLGKRFAFRYV